MVHAPGLLLAECDALAQRRLQAVEAGFERAWQDGRVSLHTDVGAGPALDGAHGAGAGAAAAAAAQPAATAPPPTAAPTAGAH